MNIIQFTKSKSGLELIYYIIVLKNYVMQMNNFKQHELESCHI